MKYYAVINLGLRSIRVILFDENAEIVEKNWYPVRTLIDRDRVEQDPNEWWSLCTALLREVFSKSQYGKQVSSITVTSSAACLVVLDEKGKTLDNSYIVSDKRSHEQAVYIGAHKDFTDIFTRPNHQATASFMFPKLLWLKRHSPDIFKKAAYYMSSNDFLIYRLTGKFVTDPLNAEKFYYDPDKKTYPSKLLKMCGIKKSHLPEVVPVATVIGPLRAAFAKELRIGKQCNVIVSTYDAICAFIGSGVSQEGDTCNVCGTVSSVRTFTRKQPRNKKGILSQNLFGVNIVGGSNNIDGGLLEWSKNMFYGDSYPEKSVYKIMENEASESAPGARGLIFTPYISGERLPFFDPVARGMFFGLERYHTRSDIMRSVFEAGSFMVYDIIRNIEKSGIKVNDLYMSGGLTLNKIACRIRADITGKRIYLSEELETTSMGALVIMLLAERKISDLHELKRFVRIKEVFEPDLKMHAYYKEIFKLFKNIYLRNKILMTKRKDLMALLAKEELFVLENL